MPGGRPWGKTKSGKRKPSAQDEFDLAMGGKSVGGGATDSIRPSGRAPKGKGKEYADRRAIANKIDTQIRYKQNAQQGRDSYRGTKAGRRVDNYRQTRIQELSKSIDAALRIADAPGDWGFKRELIEGLLSHVAAQSTAVR